MAAVDIDQAALDGVVDEIAAAGYPVRGWPLDVSDRAAIDRAIPAIAAHFGGIDILINNAGIGAGGRVDADDYEANWQRAFDVLVTAHVRIIRAALPFLRQADGGRIVNIASTEGLGATKYSSPYTAAKTAVIGLTRSLAVEFGTEGITVNCICPGPVRTGMTDCHPGGEQARVRPPTRGLEALRGSRGSSARHAEPSAAGRGLHHRRGAAGGWRLDDQERLMATKRLRYGVLNEGSVTPWLLYGMVHRSGQSPLAA